MKLQVLDFFNNSVKEDINLDENIFNVRVRKDILARVVNWQLAKRRSGNHKVKTRGEVKHTTKKPFKQKGTGQARQGMKSVPHMRGGGVAMGPVVRSYYFKLNKKVRNIGLKCALSSKAQNNKLIIVNDLSLDKIKTLDISKKLKETNLHNTLFIDSNDNNNNHFALSIRNVHKADILKVVGLNVLDVLNHETLVLTRDSIKDIAERLNG